MNVRSDAPLSTFAILEGTPNALFPNGMRLVRLITESEFNTLRAAGATPGANQVLASAQSFDFAPSRNKGDLRRPGVRYQGEVTWASGQRLTAGSLVQVYSVRGGAAAKAGCGRRAQGQGRPARTHVQRG